MSSISEQATNSSLTAIENKIPEVSSLVKRQIMMQRLVKLKIIFMIIIMTNILLLQSLILWQQAFLMQD